MSRMCRVSLLSLASLVCVAPLASMASEPGSSGAQPLKAASSSSPRPDECRPSGSRWTSHGATLWDRAREPRLARYCDALARGYARLGTDPAAALQAASLAAEAQPRRSAPLLLKARALLEQDRQRDALAVYQELLQKQPELRLTPDALYTYARALAGSGERKPALDAYRRLVPMAGLASPVSEIIYVEAALLVMLADPGELQEAVAYLNEARRRNAVPVLRPYALAALALALDRQGRPEEARGVANEARGRTSAMLSQLETSEAGPRARTTLPRIDRLELLPMIAILMVEDDPETAREYWREFSDEAPESHPWLAHARAKLAVKGRRGP